MAASEWHEKKKKKIPGIKQTFVKVGSQKYG